MVQASMAIPDKFWYFQNGKKDVICLDQLASGKAEFNLQDRWTCLTM